MAGYDYRCRHCDSVFEVRRGVSEDSGDVRCPSGHRDVARVWSAVSVAVAGRSATPAPRTAMAGAGGCCGGGCCGGG